MTPKEHFPKDFRDAASTLSVTEEGSHSGASPSFDIDLKAAIAMGWPEIGESDRYPCYISFPEDRHIDLYRTAEIWHTESSEDWRPYSNLAQAWEVMQMVRASLLEALNAADYLDNQGDVMRLVEVAEKLREKVSHSVSCTLPSEAAKTILCASLDAYAAITPEIEPLPKTDSVNAPTEKENA
jgi:hypothetical protein